MEAKLVVVGGDVKASEIRLTVPAVLGRSQQADVRLPHPLVSRRHCEITESDGLLRIRDLGSLNGTFVDNQRIRESVLKPQQVFAIGPIVLRAVYEADQAALAQLEAQARQANASDETVRTKSQLADIAETQTGDGFAPSAEDQAALAGDAEELDWSGEFEVESAATQPKPAADLSQDDEDEGDEELNEFFKGLGLN
jgi:pSer/pThr/pTyr-binding forkhead associated (FHA) protein